MTHRVWIEAALNGPWGRERQPGIPVTVEDIVAEGIACAMAGAAIIHVHAYDPATGRQRDDWETYARIIEGIRGATDAIVYPTIPLAAVDGEGAASDVARFAHLDELARRGLVEWAVVDPGSVNMSRFDHIEAGSSGFVYWNPESHIRRGLEICASAGVRPSFAVYEPGFTRLGAALTQRYPELPVPVYRFMFSDEFAWGYPPAQLYLRAHLHLLESEAPDAPWMVAGLGVDISPLIPLTVADGGHVRVGLEDAPWGSPLSNVAWVRRAVDLVRANGGEPATPADIRSFKPDARRSARRTR